MKDVTFITGNEHKVAYLEKWLGAPVKHHNVDLDEIQALDLHAVTEHKVRQAHAMLKTPVLVEDIGFTFEAMGRLPGPLIKWFLEELGNEGLCRLADGLEHRRAHVSIVYALYDGAAMHFFEGHMRGHVASAPRGNYGFGWNAVFVPQGATKTYAEMTDDEIRPYSHRARAIEKLKAFLSRQ